MQIMIDIPEEDYDDILNGEIKASAINWSTFNAIRNGTVLPKGHGDLIERKPIYDSLIRSYRANKKDYPERGEGYRVGLSNAIDLLNVAPIIIEANTESENML